MLSEFFYFRKSDRRAFLTLFVVAVVLLVLTMVLGGGADDGSTATPSRGDSAAIRPTLPRTARQSETRYAADNSHYATDSRRKVERFCFDPNTADSTLLLRLGLRPWQVRAIYRYRAAGGVYRQPSDFARLYGLTVGEYRELEPYIHISHDYRAAATAISTTPPAQHTATAEAVRDTMRYPVKLRQGEHVPLNTADTTALKKIPGIGSYYARRIVAYRERLGGFYSASQLVEIEGLPESASAFVTVDPSAIRRINVNRLTLDQLRRHPYINYYQARDIVDYRRLRGKITDIRQLRLMRSFTDKDIERIAHYIEY